MLSFCLTVEIVCMILSIFVQIQTAVNPDKELTHDNTTYSIFFLDITTGNHIGWTNARDICVSWGGNLATIKSEQIDTLLSYLTDINSYSATWIGLNDMNNEAGTDSSKFVWVDGSDSTYRQFATSPESEAYPRATYGDWDCVSFRYNRYPNNTLSNGWHDRRCGSTVFSYFCSKPGTSNGCDLIYEDYCYQTFTVLVVTNWNDAQSTCAVWGGDLTSIPTLRVNNFIQTVLPDTKDKYWIGLYEENGSLMWIDGSTSSYTNTPSSTGSCVTMDTDGDWLRNECDIQLNNFICRRNSNYIEEYEMRRELTFEDSTFAIFTTFPRISWSAARDNCISWGGSLATIKSSQQDTLLYNLADIDVYYASWIGLNDRDIEAGDTPNGFVWVDGSDSNHRQFATIPFSYPSGVTVGSDCVSFRYKYLTVLSDGWYDRECDGAVFSYYCQKAGISKGCDLIYEDSCYRAFETIDRINWNYAQSTCAVWGGDLTSISSQRVNDFMQTLRSNTNSEYWIGLNGDRHENFLWNDGTTSNYRNFRSNGVSNFNSASCVIMESDGEWRNSDCTDEIGGFICNRSPSYDTGYTAPNTISTSIHGIVQNGSVLSFDEDVIIMNCTISNPTYTVEWYYRTLTDGNVTNVTSLSVFSPQTGISSLDINSNEQGYYDCVINRDSLYTVFLTHISSLVTITSLSNPSQQMDYTVGSTTSILFYSQSDVPDNSLRWTTDTVSDGDNQQYSIEYTNPVDLSVVFSDTGAGVQRLSCFYRMSPVTLLGSLQIAIRDAAMLTISYEGYSNTFNDVNNSMFPSPQMISILEDTTNVTLSCSQCLMIQSVIQDVLTNITNLPYVISVFSEDNDGRYMLLRETPSGIQYTTAHVYVSFTPNTTSTTSPSMTIIYIVVPVCVIVAVILLVVMIILIICLVKYRKRNTRSMKGASEDNKRSTITSMRLEDTSDEDHPVKPIDNGYMTLDQLDMEVNIPDSKPQDETTFTQTMTYEEVTDIMDPRMLPISLDIFKSHMDSLWKKECGLEEEYKSLGGKEHRYPCQSANILDNKPKNRFKLIYPYDKDRVLLDCTYANTVSDYINASHIPGIYVKEKFIAAQGPKENTIESFWQMIIENKVVNIVMLTNLVESGKKKCEKYFPLEIGSNLVFGPYNISLEREELFMGYAIKMLKVIFPGGEERIKHFHFTAWPDHDVPNLYDELLRFVTYVQESLKQSKAPIVVHCSAGVGRTGTFITLYNITNAIKHKSSISIYRIVHEMREHRPQMVQTFAQYKFIYLSVLEILLGTTSIKTKEFLNTYKLYMKSEYDGYVSVFYQQFSELNYQCEKGFSPACEAALLECNRTKNPVKNVLPYDMNRVELCSQHWGENYINATSLDCGQIIVTIDPTQDTLRDFYQLIYQMNPNLIIMLSSPKKLKQIQQGNSDRVVYWPTPGNPLRTEPFTVTHSNSEESSFIKNIFDITHNIDNCSISCTQIIVTDWNEKDEPKLENIISLLQTIFQSQKQSPAAPVLIHCEDGAGKSGVLYTVYKAMKESKERGLIDIFHIAKKLRSERMNSVSNLTQFVSCFTLMNEYCSKAN